MESSTRPLPVRSLPPLRSQNKNRSHELEETNVDDNQSTPSRAANTSRKLPSRLPPVTADENLANVQTLNETPNEEQSAQTRRARAKRRQKKESRTSKDMQQADVVENGHALTQMISEDDVLAVENVDSVAAITTIPGVTGVSGGISQQQDSVYVQTARGFRRRPGEWVDSRQVGVSPDDNLGANVVNKSNDVAIAFHKGLMIFAFLMHGLLGGICIWQIYIPLSLNSRGEVNFVEQYGPLAQPIQSIIYFLIVLCLLSSLDRYNLAKPKQYLIVKLLKFQPSAWLTAVYFLIFFIHVGMAGIDFWLGRIALAASNDSSTVVSSYLSQDIPGSVRTWLALNTIRAGLSILGWFIVTIRPREDNTIESLLNNADGN